MFPKCRGGKGLYNVLTFQKSRGGGKNSPREEMPPPPLLNETLPMFVAVYGSLVCWIDSFFVLILSRYCIIVIVQFSSIVLLCDVCKCIHMARLCAPLFDALPESAPSCKVPNRFSRENAARFAESRRVGKNRGAFDKKRRNTLPAQIQRLTIKVQHVSYQKMEHTFLISVVFFLTYTMYTNEYILCLLHFMGV